MGGGLSCVGSFAAPELGLHLSLAKINNWGCFVVGACDNKVLSLSVATAVCLRSKSPHYTREKNRLHYAKLKRASFPPLTDASALKILFTVDGGTREA